MDLTTFATPYGQPRLVKHKNLIVNGNNLLIEYKTSMYKGYVAL